MPTPISTKGGRRGGKDGPGCSSHGSALWKLLGHGVSHPLGTGSQGTSSPYGTGSCGREGGQGNFWIGLWELEGIYAEAQRTFNPDSPETISVLFHIGHAVTMSAPGNSPPTGPEPQAPQLSSTWGGFKDPHHPVGLWVLCVWASVLGRGTCPHPLPLPRSLFLLFPYPHFHLLAWWLHQTLLAHRFGPSADEVHGVLLRHKMWLSLISPPIFSWQLLFGLKYLNSHLSGVNLSQTQLCGLAGSWLSPYSHGFTQPAVAPTHLPEEETPQTACRLSGNVLPTVGTHESDFFLALPDYSPCTLHCSPCILCYSPCTLHFSR